QALHLRGKLQLLDWYLRHRPLRARERVPHDAVFIFQRRTSSSALVKKRTEKLCARDGGRGVGKLRPAHALSDSRAGSRHRAAVNVELVVAVERVEQVVHSLPRELHLEPQLPYRPLPDNGNLFDLLRPLARPLGRCFRGRLRRGELERRADQHPPEECDNGPAGAGVMRYFGSGHKTYSTAPLSTRQRYLIRYASFCSRAHRSGHLSTSLIRRSRSTQRLPKIRR